MERFDFMAAFESMLASQIFWGAISLFLAAFAVKGKIPMTVANWLLLGSGLTACVGIYRSAVILRLPWIPRTLVMGIVVCAIGLILYYTNQWLDEKALGGVGQVEQDAADALLTNLTQVEVEILAELTQHSPSTDRKQFLEAMEKKGIASETATYYVHQLAQHQPEPLVAISNADRKGRPERYAITQAGRKLRLDATEALTSNLFLFKDDQRFTEDRKARIIRQLTSFREYLRALGLDAPSHPLFIGIGEQSATFTWPFMGNKVGPSTEQLSVYENQIDDEVAVVECYSEFLMVKLSQPDKPDFDTGEYLARTSMNSTLARYFNWSFRNEKKGIATDWLEALWSLRTAFGPTFTDRLMAYTLKSFADGSSYKRTFKYNPDPTKPVNVPNRYVDSIIYSHLELAERVVDNEDAKLPDIRKILIEQGRTIELQ